MKNKKGQVTVFVVVGIILLLIFLVSIRTGFALIKILNEIPAIIWYLIIAIILYRLFSGGKK